jgi:uncharacterized protein (TIGR03066 family)
MKTLKLLAVGMVACLFAAGARAEEKVDYAKKLLGKWEVTKADEGTLPTGSIIEFAKEGVIKVTIKMGDSDMALDGKYTVEGDKFTVIFKIGDDEHKNTITITKMTDKECTTKDKDGKVVECKRKS